MSKPKYIFTQDRVRTHHDGPKNVEQIYLTKPYQWLCSADTKSEARRIIKIVKELLRMPQGAQLVNQLFPVIKERNRD